MSAPALQHLGKENDGSAYQNMASIPAPAAYRAAFQEKNAKNYIIAEAGGVATHPKLQPPLSALGLDPSENAEGVATRSEVADATNEGNLGPSTREAPTMQASSFGLSVSQNPSGLRQASALTEQPISVSAQEEWTSAHKAHPPGKG